MPIQRYYFRAILLPMENARPHSYILVTGASGQLGSELKEVSKQFPEFNWIFAGRSVVDVTNPEELLEYVWYNKEFGHISFLRS